MPRGSIAETSPRTISPAAAYNSLGERESELPGAGKHIGVRKQHALVVKRRKIRLHVLDIGAVQPVHGDAMTLTQPILGVSRPELRFGLVEIQAAVMPLQPFGACLHHKRLPGRIGVRKQHRQCAGDPLDLGFRARCQEGAQPRDQLRQVSPDDRQRTERIEQHSRHTPDDP